MSTKRETTETLKDRVTKDLIVKVCINIMLTCPCYVDPLTSQFYIVKLGFTGYTFFLTFALKHRSWALVNT